MPASKRKSGAKAEKEVVAEEVNDKENVENQNVEVQPEKKSKSKKKKQDKEETSEQSEPEKFDPKTPLFTVIEKRISFSAAIDHWVKKYAKSKASAVADLINLLFQCCRCSAEVSDSEMPSSSEEAEDLLAKLVTPDFLKNAEADYLLSKKSSNKKFKKHFNEFFQKFVNKLSTRILYDETLFSTITYWIAAFSKSRVRSFRHTATVAGINIVTGLIKIALRVRKELEITQRQEKGEKKKGSTTKVNQYAKKSAELHSNQITLDKTILMRYRDINPDIRVASISALGSWIHDYPVYFLEDSYLKYLGWSLGDKVVDVRKTALEALETIYKRDDFLPQLQSFTERFVDRLVEMCKDKDSSVCADAIKVAALLNRMEALTEKHIEDLQQLIVDENCVVRHEAAPFVHSSVFEADNESSRSSGASKLTASAQLRKLLQFVNESLVPDLPNYVVDALWGRVEIFTNWSAMTELLLMEDETSALSDREQLLLVRLINTCVKKANGKVICPKTKTDPEKHDRKNVKQQNQEHITKHFSKYLPKLLTQYQADPAIIEELVELPQYFDLELYSSQRQSNYFAQLLNQLAELFMKQTKRSVLSNISQTFQYLAATEHELQRDAQLTVKSLFEQLLEKLDQLPVKDSEDEEDKEDDRRANYSRLEVLTKQHKPLTLQNKLMEQTSGFLSAISKTPQRFASHQYSTSAALGTMSQLLLWSFAAIDPSKPDLKAINDLADARNSFVEFLDIFVQKGTYHIKEKAFMLLCDLFVVFSRNMKDTVFSKLAYEPSDALQETLSSAFETLIQYSRSKKESEENEDMEEEDEEERTEKLCLSLSRPIVFNALSKWLAPNLLVHLMSYGKATDEVLKNLLAKLRQREPKEEYQLVFLTLVKQYDTYLARLSQEEKDEMFAAEDENAPENDDELPEPVDTESEEALHSLTHFKELSHRLTLTYGANLSKESEMRGNLYRLIHAALNHFFLKPIERMKFLGYGVDKFASRLSPDSAAGFLKFCKSEAARLEEKGITFSKKNPLHLHYFKFLNHLQRISTGEPPKSPKKGKKSKAPDAEKATLDVVGGQQIKKKKTKDSSEEPKRKSPRKKVAKSIQYAEDSQESGNNSEEDKQTKKKSPKRKKDSPKKKKVSSKQEEAEEEGSSSDEKETKRPPKQTKKSSTPKKSPKKSSKQKEESEESQED